MSAVVNKKMYAWGSIKIRLDNAIIAEATEVEYSEEQAIDEVYAQGDASLGPGYGQISNKGKLVVLEEFAQKLQTKANTLTPNKRIQEMTFNLDVIKDDGVNPVIVHKLKDVIIKNNGRKAKTGDKQLGVEYDLYIQKIEW